MAKIYNAQGRPCRIPKTIEGYSIEFDKRDSLVFCHGKAAYHHQSFFSEENQEGKINQSFRVIKKTHRGGQAAIYLVEPKDGPLTGPLVFKHFQRHPEGDSTIIKNLTEGFDELKSEKGIRLGYYDEWLAIKEATVLSQLQGAYPYQPNTFPHVHASIDSVIVNQGLVSERQFNHNFGFVMSYAGRPVDLNNKSIDVEKVADYLIRKVFAFQIQDLIHKDLSLKNILIGEGDKPQIIDFALCCERRDIEEFKGNLEKQLSRQIEKATKRPSVYGMVDTSQAFWGNRLFAPPEVYAKRIHEKHDNWSLGIIVYSLFTGKHLVPIDLKEEIDLTSEVSTDQKRRYVEFLTEVGRNSRLAGKLQKEMGERIFGSDIPERMQAAIEALTWIKSEERVDLVDILALLGLKPYVPKRYVHYNLLVGIYKNMFVEKFLKPKHEIIGDMMDTVDQIKKDMEERKKEREKMMWRNTEDDP